MVNDLATFEQSYVVAIFKRYYNIGYIVTKKYIKWASKIFYNGNYGKREWYRRMCKIILG